MITGLFLFFFLCCFFNNLICSVSVLFKFYLFYVNYFLTLICSPYSSKSQKKWQFNYKFSHYYIEEKSTKRALKPLWRWTISSLKYDDFKWQKNLFPTVKSHLGEDWWLRMLINTSSDTQGRGEKKKRQTVSK